MMNRSAKDGARSSRQYDGEVVLTHRDLESIMNERGVALDHSTIYRWVQRYAPQMEKRLRWQWRCPPLVELAR